MRTFPQQTYSFIRTDTYWNMLFTSYHKINITFSTSDANYHVSVHLVCNHAFTWNSMLTNKYRLMRQMMFCDSLLWLSLLCFFTLSWQCYMSVIFQCLRFTPSVYSLLTNSPSTNQNGKLFSSESWSIFVFPSAFKIGIQKKTCNLTLVVAHYVSPQNFEVLYWKDGMAVSASEALSSL